MYRFTRHKFDWLLVHEARPPVGARHLKVFVAPTAPKDQLTLNLYLAGAFELTVAGLKHTLVAGQSSLDLPDEPVAAGQIVLERPVEPDSVRLCLQPENASVRWSRRRVTLRPGERVAPLDGFVVRLCLPVSVSREHTANGAETVFVVERINEAKATA